MRDAEISRKSLAPRAERPRVLLQRRLLAKLCRIKHIPRCPCPAANRSNRSNGWARAARMCARSPRSRVASSALHCTRRSAAGITAPRNASGANCQASLRWARTMMARPIVRCTRSSSRASSTCSTCFRRNPRAGSPCRSTSSPPSASAGSTKRHYATHYHEGGKENGEA